MAWLAIGALLLLTNASAIAQRHFPDPDDTLRLVQVRALIAGQGWFDLHVHRVDPLDGGVLMHWSRLVDIPIAAVILALRPLVGQEHAELVALVTVPLLTLGCLLLLVGRVAWQKLGREASLLACLIVAMSVPVVQQVRPMRIDHHGWQIVAALGALNGLMARNARIGGWVAGVSLALGMAISLEGLPLAAVFAGLGAWRWLRGGADREWLVAYMQALAAGSVLCFLATRGLADLVNHCDAISPVHLTVFVFGAVALTGLSIARGLPTGWLLAGFAAIGGGALAIVALAAPQCTSGTFNELDPVVRALWFDQIAEGLPIWKQDLATALQIAVPGLVGLAAAWRLSRRGSEGERLWWREYMLLLAGALAIAALVARAGGVSGAYAAVPLAWQLERWLKGARQGSTLARVPVLLGVALVMAPSLPLTLLGMIAPARAGAGAPSGVGPSLAPGPGPTHVSACDIRQGAQALNRLPAGNMLAPLDIGPELLLYTPNTVLATSHHRGAKAMREVIDAFTGNDDAAHLLVAHRRIAYVALCPGLGEPSLYAHVAPRGFAAQLQGGKAPGWLRPLGPAEDGRLRSSSGLRVWRVVG